MATRPRPPPPPPPPPPGPGMPGGLVVVVDVVDVGGRAVVVVTARLRRLSLGDFGGSTIGDSVDVVRLGRRARPTGSVVSLGFVVGFVVRLRRSSVARSVLGLVLELPPPLSWAFPLLPSLPQLSLPGFPPFSPLSLVVLPVFVVVAVVVVVLLAVVRRNRSWPFTGTVAGLVTAAEARRAMNGVAGPLIRMGGTGIVRGRRGFGKGQSAAETTHEQAGDHEAGRRCDLHTRTHSSPPLTAMPAGAIH